MIFLNLDISTHRHRHSFAHMVVDSDSHWHSFNIFSSNCDSQSDASRQATNWKRPDTGASDVILFPSDIHYCIFRLRRSQRDVRADGSTKVVDDVKSKHQGFIFLCRILAADL